jgi:hypothetical protein
MLGLSELPCVDAFSIRTVEDQELDFGPQLRSMLQNRCMDWGDLPRENDNGYIEYKWRLGPEHGESARAERLVTQMRFRLAEGNGTAFYLLGVRDSGGAPGLTPKEHAEAVRVLMGVAAALGSMLVLEALSEPRKGRSCSAWRVQARRLTKAQQRQPSPSLVDALALAPGGGDRHRHGDRGDNPRDAAISSSPRGGAGNGLDTQSSSHEHIVAKAMPYSNVDSNGCTQKQKVCSFGGEATFSGLRRTSSAPDLDL